MYYIHHEEKSNMTSKTSIDLFFVASKYTAVSCNLLDTIMHID